MTEIWLICGCRVTRPCRSCRSGKGHFYLLIAFSASMLLIHQGTKRCKFLVNPLQFFCILRFPAGTTMGKDLCPPVQQIYVSDYLVFIRVNFPLYAFGYKLCLEAVSIMDLCLATLVSDLSRGIMNCSHSFHSVTCFFPLRIRHVSLNIL